MADRKLFEAEALPWIDTVYRAALGICAQPSLADDLVQSTYLKAWQRFDQFGAGTNCRAWLLTILQNTWVDHLRQRNHVQWTASEALDQVAAAPQTADPPSLQETDRVVEQFDNERLVAALARLPDDFRLAIFLVDIEGYTHQEAAEVLGVPAGTVKSRTSRARRMIQERLAKPSIGSRPGEEAGEKAVSDQRSAASKKKGIR